MEGRANIRRNKNAVIASSVQKPSATAVPISKADGSDESDDSASDTCSTFQLSPGAKQPAKQKLEQIYAKAKPAPKAKSKLKAVIGKVFDIKLIEPFVPTSETPLYNFVASECCCGNAKTKFWTAHSLADVQRRYIRKDFTPNPFFMAYDRKDELSEGAAFLNTVKRAIETQDMNNPNFVVQTPVGVYPSFDEDEEIRTNSTSEEILNRLPADVVDILFRFFFTGGEGEQHGNPGKEWNSIEISPFDKVVFKNVYEIRI